jgi:hypothetical protein
VHAKIFNMVDFPAPFFQQAQCGLYLFDYMGGNTSTDIDASSSVGKQVVKSR